MDKLTGARNQVNAVKAQVLQVAALTIDRNEKIETLINETEKLGSMTPTFKRQAHVVERRMCWKNIKWTIFAAIGILVNFFLF